jgi:hypothetical protein
MLINSISGLAQQANNADKNEAVKEKDGRGFHTGLYIGSLFANKYTASLYDGYGYDLNGNKNTFENSFMYRKIVMEYGGGNGQIDQIALALNVDHGDWTFDETDMPINLRYNTAFLVGFHSRYCMNKKDAILLNVNASKLSINGAFTIIVTRPPFGPQVPGYMDIRTFSITGGEERLMFQLGYQRILGDDNKLNFFIEGGANLSMAKFEKNQIMINSLLIDLTTFYNQFGYIEYRAKNLTGIGIGAFSGLGLNLSMSPKWTLQLLYNLSLEGINIGEDHKLKLQQAIGLRGYYNL